MANKRERTNSITTLVNDPVLTWNPPSEIKPGPWFSESQGIFDLNTFVLTDDPFYTSSETMPILTAELCQSPFYDIDATAILIPQLMDAYSTAVTPDSWDWNSCQVDSTASTDNLEHLEEENVEVEPEFSTTDIKAFEAKVEQSNDKRGFIVCELLATEENYTTQLKIALYRFRSGLKSAKVVPNKSIDLIFRGMDELLPHHISFLEDLQAEIGIDKYDSETSRIGKIFLKHRDKFVKYYETFISSYMMAEKTEKECQANQEYCSFVQQLSQKPECNRQELKDLLPIPVQRIGKYPLLLRDLLKKTSEDHPDYQDLKAAFEAVKALAEKVNEKKRQEEERTGLFENYTKTKNCPARLVSAKRRWIVNIPTTEVKSKKEAWIMIFSDLVMIAVPISKAFFSTKNDTQYLYKFVRWIDILEIDLEIYKIEIKVDPSLSQSKNRSSNTTTNREMSGVLKELLASSITFQFSGYEGQKNYNMLKNTIASEIKRATQDAENESNERASRGKNH